jgi:hypothetical protein
MACRAGAGADLFFRHKKDELALRFLIEHARRNAWRDALALPGVDPTALSGWIAIARRPGQGEASWALRTGALDALHPTWKAELRLDGDVFATISGTAGASSIVRAEAHHVFTIAEIEAAVDAVQPDLRDFYVRVLAFSKMARPTRDG